MENHHGKCAVCDKGIPISLLYPIPLIRPSVLESLRKSNIELPKTGYICQKDLNKVNSIHVQRTLADEKGALSKLEKEVLESFKSHELISENQNIEYEENLTFGDRLADKIALFGGSWKFISLFGFILLAWMFCNVILIKKEPFDPYPFILLNLVLSCLAAIQAPIIMMSQNRQAAKDRLKTDHDYIVNLKAELQIRQLNSKFDLFMKHTWERMHELYQIQSELSDIIQSEEEEIP